MAAAGAAVALGKEQAMPRIVVGIDGSPNSERALDWAMKQAAAVHAPLTVITVHEVPKSFWVHPGDRRGGRGAAGKTAPGR